MPTGIYERTAETRAILSAAQMGHPNRGRKGMISSEEKKIRNRAATKKYKIAHPEKAKLAVKLAQWKRDYGISQEQYDKLFALQGGKCVICGNETFGILRNGKPKGLCIDHDHKTGKVRGLLCTRCNSILGYANDDSEILMKLIDYLIISSHGGD